MYMIYVVQRQRLLPNPNVLVAVSKGMLAVKLHQQNTPVLNWWSQLMQVYLYNGHKTMLLLLCVNPSWRQLDARVVCKQCQKVWVLKYA